MEALYYYIILINIVTFIAYLADKIFAIKGMWRIPEKTLLGLAAIGGSLGAIFGIWGVRHKTKHRNFTIGVPVMFVIHLIILVLVLREQIMLL